MGDLVGIDHNVLMLGPLCVLAAVLCVGLILLIAPWLRAHALAQPNARSSHRVPTPQGGGAPVIVATFAAAWAGAALLGASLAGELGQLALVTGAAALLALLGALDDFRGLPAAPRLAVQCAAVAIVVATLPVDLRFVPALPWSIERIGLVLAAVWFVNLTNFMDGIDWMTVVEVVPIAGAVIVLGLMGALPPLPVLIALGLLGAICGFAPFNKPVARLFLGDAGSLPIGLVLTWLLLQVAGRGHVAAALLLPLYYLADATITLGRRLLAGERIWQAHRTHFYQRATDRGFAVPEIVGRVFAVNLALAALAVFTVAAPGPAAALAALAVGAALVGALLWRFARGKAR